MCSLLARAGTSSGTVNRSLSMHWLLRTICHACELANVHQHPSGAMHHCACVPPCLRLLIHLTRPVHLLTYQWSHVREFPDAMTRYDCMCMGGLHVSASRCDVLPM